MRPWPPDRNRKAGAFWNWHPWTAPAPSAGFFSSAIPGTEYRLWLRGLDAGQRYRVTWDNSCQTSEVDGFTLMNEGVTVRLEGPLTSELSLC